MKTIFFLIISFLITSNSFSQNGWFLQQSSTGKNLNDVFFINSITGWIAGDSNVVLKTTNSGLNWTSQILPYYSPLRAIYFIDENTGWCCGGVTFPLNGGNIYKTTNGGINWISIYNLGGSCVNDIYFIDQNTGFRADNASLDFGSAGSISKTVNGGITWFETTTYSQYVFTSIRFRNANSGWATGYWWSDAGGDSTVIFKTTNEGVSWNAKFKERGGEPNDIFSFNDFVWISGKDSCILHSSNGGETWDKQYTNTPRRFNSVFFTNENTGWAVGYRYPDTTNIVKTTNGGLNWFNLNNSFGYVLYSVNFVNENTGWTVGNSGLILKTITGGLTSINQSSSTIPTSFILHQNYPNPFNPVTNLEFGISDLGFVLLKVYDITGKEVATLVNEKLSGGSYEVEFNANNLSSGIYFYSLYVNDILFQTKRMILLK